MELSKNKFKAGLCGDETLWGLWLGLANTTCAEISASAGFDWLLIDGEHAPFELQSMQHHLQALAAYEVSPIVRIEEGRTALIKRVLDIGAQTILVPMVDTAEQARELVLDVNYPPVGRRGMGGALARAARWNRIPDYTKTANDEICLIIQVETVEAMQNLDQIAAVEGIDGIFIGPTDLSASMGHIGNANHPDVVAAIEQGIETINKSGKAAGLLSVNVKAAHHYESKGAKFIGVGVDTLLLANATKQLADSVKNRIPTNKSPSKQNGPSGY
jgi:4-hydroxy-2-oxoheptanedioate aldolase